jgi:hypothetical protein
MEFQIIFVIMFYMQHLCNNYTRLIYKEISLNIFLYRSAKNSGLRLPYFLSTSDIDYFLHLPIQHNNIFPLVSSQNGANRFNVNRSKFLGSFSTTKS